MIEDHAHGVFQIFKLFGVNVMNLRISYLSVLNKGEEDVRSQRLDLQIEFLGDLALFQTLIYSPYVLP
jgi:hypothetical protein